MSWGGELGKSLCQVLGPEELDEKIEGSEEEKVVTSRSFKQLCPAIG